MATNIAQYYPEQQTCFKVSTPCTQIAFQATVTKQGQRAGFLQRQHCVHSYEPPSIAQSKMYLDSIFIIC